ncbi:MAG: AraC family transcriptional regulator [Hahellaceae bacterium]|nr:AraC family transcriptional regulator [Hahellaceae bacterium]
MRISTQYRRWMVAGTLLAGLAGVVRAENEAPVAAQVEDLKKQVINLNRDLFILEEDLLFPASTQLAVFLSVDTGKFMRLDAVKLKVDGEVVAAHLYTDTQLKALARGGMQRLYLGNVKSGAHEITAFVEGLGPDNRTYKKASSLTINKETDIKSLEIRLKDLSTNYEPEVSIVEWE